MSHIQKNMRISLCLVFGGDGLEMEGTNHQHTGICTLIVFNGPENRFDLAIVNRTYNYISNMRYKKVS